MYGFLARPSLPHARACRPCPRPPPSQSLTDESHHVEEELAEAEAKNKLYVMLLERTRREHMAIDQQVRMRAGTPRMAACGLRALPCVGCRAPAGSMPLTGGSCSVTPRPCRRQVRGKQESKRNCGEDLRNLQEHLGAMRAAKELAERELAKVRRSARRRPCIGGVPQRIMRSSRVHQLWLRIALERLRGAGQAPG